MCGGTQKTSAQPGCCSKTLRNRWIARCLLADRWKYSEMAKGKHARQVTDYFSDTDCTQSSWPCTEFDLNCIRLIVYQDCERRGRQVLFDSKAVREVKDENPQRSGEEAPTRSKPCQTSSSGTCTISSRNTTGSSQPARETLPKYQYTKPASDVNMLGEMMFGSVAMSYKGSTLKIHLIRCPLQLMISKVFSAKVGGFSTSTIQDSVENMSHDGTGHKLGVSHTGQGSCLTTSNLGILQICGSKLLPSMFEVHPLRLIRSASFFAAHSTPVDMPSRGQNEDKDSGIARSASLSSLLITPLPSPSSSFSSNCASSYQRRWLRSQITSLENGVVPRWNTEETFSMADDSYTSNPVMVGRKKIAISILFSLPEAGEAQHNFQDFFFSHFPLFESHMNKLKSAIEKAMISCRKITESSQRVQFYLSQVMEALGHFRETIWNLYCAPRIAEPVWLTMMSCTTEKSQLCQHFLKELAYLTEQLNKNQFFAALITAVLTYHLAWVPTVMPNDHPPIKSFCEKHTSQSVNLLAKSHPYNPLWAQLGDLYGAIGSPVRMTRTVVAGKRKDLVQRILYILTYFIRCSELQENHLVHSRALKKGEQMVQGSNVTTSLEKGEVEDSDYVLITLNKESALLAPSLPYNGCGSPLSGLEPSNTSVAREHTTDGCSPSTQRSAKSSTSHEANLGDGGSCKKRITLVKEAKVETLVSVTRTPVYNVEDVFTSNSLTSHVKSHHHTGQYNKKASAPVQLSDWAKEVLRADQKDKRYSPGKVNYTLGQSTASNTDVETCRKELDENGKSVLCRSDQPSASKPYSLAADRRRLMHSRIPSCEGGSSLFDEYFVEGNSIETNTVECLPGHSLLSEKCFVSTIVEDNCTSGRTCEKDQIGPANTEAHRPQKTSQTVPCGDPLRKTGGRLEGNIPRNRSYDSALGHSEEELNAGRTLLESQDHNNDHAEVELPLPRSDVISSSSVKNFGRSLIGGYCSSYMPDMVLHGIASAEKLKSCLSASLAHATHHPVLDEPLAEAVCIVADTDKCSVQVVSSQKTTVDNVKLGTDVLVSSQVCSLLQSILQLHKLKVPPMFCVMHLEDKLQELYLKSKMLSEYLRGHTRVHVKELGVVLGIESSDLPLLAAVASTHSPHVAQILL